MNSVVIPDVPTPSTIASHRPVAQPQASSANEFAKVLDDLGSVLGHATESEDNFANGSGDLQTAVYERARADVALAVATAAAQRTTAALQSIFNMQV